VAQQVLPRRQDESPATAERKLTSPTDKSQVNRPGGAMFNRPQGNFSDDYASFVTLNNVGLSHTIRLEAMAVRPVQEPGAVAPRYETVQGSGTRVQFFEGAYFTNDPWVIDQLLNNKKYKFDTDFTINPKDPTGYWRKHHADRFEFVEHKEVVRKGSDINANLGVGPRPAHRSTMAAAGMR